MNCFTGSAGRTRFCRNAARMIRVFFGSFRVTKHYKNRGFGLRDQKNVPQGTAALFEIPEKAMTGRRRDRISLFFSSEIGQFFSASWGDRFSFLTNLHRHHGATTGGWQKDFNHFSSWSLLGHFFMTLLSLFVRHFFAPSSLYRTHLTAG